MAITATQRQRALTTLLADFNDPTALNSLLPGVTPAQIVTAILTAVGVNFDAQLTTIMNNIAAQEQTNLTNVQAAVTTLQNQIAQDTVI